MPLNISLKNHVSGNPIFAQSQRQIELWANNYKQTPFVFASGWSNAGGGASVGAWSQDCTGSVHLHGTLYGPALTGGTAYTITTLPVGVAPPQYTYTFPVVSNVAAFPALGLLYVYPSGIVQVVPGSNTAAGPAGTWYLDGIVYDRTTS